MAEQLISLDDICGPGSEAWERGCFMDRAIRLMPSIVYVFNQETQSNEYTNRSIGEVMGYSSDEIRAFGANLMPLLCHPDDLPNVLQHFKRITRLKDNDVATVEYRIRHKAGHWVWFLSMDTVFERTPDGRVRTHLGAATDITRLKAAEEQALAASKAAQTANEDLRAFAYSISHDMKSPLNTLCLLLSEFEGCHGEALDPDAKQLLDKALQTSDGMQRRIERVLDYTKLIDRTPGFAPIDLNDVLSDVIANLAADISATSAILDITPLPVVWGATEELKVLFQNIIGNAIKFSAVGQSPVIRIFDSSDPDEPECRITVSDKGIGIAEDQQETVFAMFKRLHSERAYPGSGLGLAICRRIAISHGGDITIKSKPGRGAAFTVILPGAPQTAGADLWSQASGCETG
ncbi:MAG: sensor histidine kinase [Paracoccaceae bacterium]